LEQRCGELPCFQSQQQQPGQQEQQFGVPSGCFPLAQKSPEGVGEPVGFRTARAVENSGNLPPASSFRRKPGAFLQGVFFFFAKK
jgi:hypothetical protein